MITAIIGSRHYDPNRVTLQFLAAHLPADTTEIVSGGACGIDVLAGRLAPAPGIPLREYTPDYGLFGSHAPLVRNFSIIEHADFVLAFWDYRSPGTRMVIRECLRRNKPLRITKI